MLNIYVYILVLDISGHRVVKYTISRIYNQLKIYGDIEYIMQTLGDECNLESFCEPFGRRVGKYSI